MLEKVNNQSEASTTQGDKTRVKNRQFVKKMMVIFRLTLSQTSMVAISARSAPTSASA